MRFAPNLHTPNLHTPDVAHGGSRFCATLAVVDPQTRLTDLCRKRLDRPVADRLVGLARPAQRLVRSELSASRLGGHALLAPGTAWPRWDGRPLSLLAVIEHAGGFLNFFYEARDQEAWGFSPGHADGWRVIRTPSGVAVETAAPGGSLVFTVVRVGCEPMLTLPSWEEPVFEDFGSDAGEVASEWRDLIDEPFHQLGGWPRLVQGSLWQEADAASRGIGAGGPDPRASAGAEEWRLLLQLDTDDGPGWMWGDVGRLFYTIRERDLAAGDFSRCWLSLQSY